MIVSEVMSPPDCHDDPTTQHGTWFLSGRHVCKLGIEGIVSKRLGLRYISGRTRDWLTSSLEGILAYVGGRGAESNRNELPSGELGE
jgi:hypothetical protein